MKSSTARTAVPTSRSGRGVNATRPTTANVRGSSDPSALAMQQTINNLEQRIASLEQVLDLDSSGNLRFESQNITLSANQLILESSAKTTIRAGTGLKLSSSSKFECESSGQMSLSTTGNLEVNVSGNAKIKATSKLELTSSGIASLSGSSTKLGPGSKPVSVGSVSGGAGGVNFSATMPSPTVLA